MPDVPGVYAAADTRDEAEIHMQEALAVYREELARSGRKPPEPSVEAGTIAA